MTHQYNFFVIFNGSALKVMPKEFSELETPFVHFEGILHSVREFIICKLQQVFTVAELRMMGFFFIYEIDVFVHFLETMNVY